MLQKKINMDTEKHQLIIWTPVFLGLGIAPPESSWGTLASTGWQGIRTFPHLIVFPSLAIFITAFSFNLLGEGLRDLIDPNRVNA